jgi:PBSX family phage terminase large subunit
VNNDLKISKRFQPLFEILTGQHPEVDTVIITGGRYSLKSYTASILAVSALVWYQWNILYTRFTNSNIVDSIKPEVSDKITLLGLDGIVTDTQTHIEHKGNRIAFKGIKPGAKMQTANLKSLSGFNCFINDEAEELPDYKTFKKIFYSIRDTEKRNLSILILNPTTKDHWIFHEFFEKKGLEGGDNCIKDNVMYIHTSYLDSTLSMMPANILKDYERMNAALGMADV